MQNLKALTDKITLAETRKSKDVVISISDARLIKDELITLLLALQHSQKNALNTDSIEIKGGSFK